MGRKIFLGASILFIIVALLVGFTSLPLMFNGTIDGRTYDMREKIENLIKNGQTTLFILDQSTQNTDNLLDYIVDNPDFFWLDYRFRVVKLGRWTIIELKNRYANREAIRKDIDTAAEEALSHCVGSQMNEYEKMVAIHDWMCENLVYEEDYKSKDQDIYGALVQKKAVCAGYAKAFAYLCRKAGLKCEVVSGVSYNSNMKEVPHAWNEVMINGVICYVDVTWDDSDSSNMWTHNWCGVSSTDISRSHFLSGAYRIKQADSRYDYYIKNGMSLESYSASALAQQIKKQGKVLNIKCTNDTAFNQLIRALENKDELTDVMRKAGISHIGTIKYMADKNAYCVRIEIN